MIRTQQYIQLNIVIFQLYRKEQSKTQNQNHTDICYDKKIFRNKKKRYMINRLKLFFVK